MLFHPEEAHVSLFAAESSHDAFRIICAPQLWMDEMSMDWYNVDSHLQVIFGAFPFKHLSIGCGELATPGEDNEDKNR
jgi:hypothetical protein